MTTTTPLGRPLSRGDVVLVLFPHADLRSAKPRPAVIVQADHLDTGLPQAVVAMITGRMFRAGHPSRVAVLKDSAVGRDSGLLSNSVVMTDNLATISEAAIERVIGHLAMDAIDVALRATLALG